VSGRKFHLGGVCNFFQALMIAFLNNVEIVVAIISFQDGMWKRQSFSMGPTTKYFSLSFPFTFFYISSTRFPRLEFFSFPL
jgi:hypothetical protein